MLFSSESKQEIGAYGEKVAEAYLLRHDFKIIGRNVVRKTGELDRVALKGKTLHVVEVKSVVCEEFPNERFAVDTYDPSFNLHPYKLQKVVRTGEWFIAERGFEGEWQVDGILVWIRRRDGCARVRYLPQIV